MCVEREREGGGEGKRREEVGFRRHCQGNLFVIPDACAINRSSSEFLFRIETDPPGKEDR